MIARSFVPTPLDRSGGSHIHPYIEEVYMMEGEMEEYLDDVDSRVAWMPGVYACRLPNLSPHRGNTYHKAPLTFFVRQGWYDKTTPFPPSQPSHHIEPLAFVE